jgi:hypothetical protein
MDTGSANKFGQLFDFLEFMSEVGSLTFERQPVNQEVLQRLVANKEKIVGDLSRLILASSVDEEKFKCIHETTVRVPRHYDHGSQLSHARKSSSSIFHLPIIVNFKIMKEFGGVDKRLKDKFFCQSYDTLEPCCDYRVRVYQLKCRMTGDECLQFLKEQGSLLVGPQGLSLIFQLGKLGNNYVDAYAYGTTDTLLQDEGGYLMVPFLKMIKHHFNDVWMCHLELEYFKNCRSPGDKLLCVNKIVM